LIIYVVKNPETLICEQQNQFLGANQPAHAFAVQFSFCQYYLAQQSNIELIAVVYLTQKNACVEISSAIFVCDEAITLAIEHLDNEVSAIKRFAQQYQTPWLNLSAPLTLAPIKIPKPWGQEIWYTGIEARGQANVVAQGFNVPLPWVLALMPTYLTAGLEKKIILLKTLDPLPDEVYGDLYFELHEKKQEVYIVTHVDGCAWENKTGAIRLGFDEKVRSSYNNAEDFKAAYLNAVQLYEKNRRAIDAVFDEERITAGIELNTPVDCATLQQWQQKCPAALVIQEQQAREYMNSFSALHALCVGDVVKIPCFVPHALQHGVRTLEFQTPVYERKILSFAQKVLTQPHWDTRAALENILLKTPAQDELPVVFASDTISVEQIVNFDDFNVVRIRLCANTTYALPPQNSYALIMPVASACYFLSSAVELNIAAETAIFVPHVLMQNSQEPLWLAAGDTAVQILVATIC
jgi:hypothetical protein